jgi:hypothetical protein
VLCLIGLLCYIWMVESLLIQGNLKMGIIITGAIVLGLLFLQSPNVARKSERVSDGFVGPVKKVFEEWSPVSGYPYPADARCRTRLRIYDSDGRLIQSSSFSNSCGSDEHRDQFTYDQDGNRIIRSEFIQGENSPPPPPPPKMPPGAKGSQVIKGPPKITFKYDAQGMISEEANFRSNGELIYKITFKYDEQGRLRDWQIDHANGTRYRYVYKYEGEKRFPASHDSFDGESETSKYTVTYTDYELNAKGDWIKRKETIKEATGRTSISIQYQTIEY